MFELFRHLVVGSVFRTPYSKQEHMQLWTYFFVLTNHTAYKQHVHLYTPFVGFQNYPHKFLGQISDEFKLGDTNCAKRNVCFLKSKYTSYLTQLWYWPFWGATFLFMVVSHDLIYCRSIRLVWRLVFQYLPPLLTGQVCIFQHQRNLNRL